MQISCVWFGSVPAGTSSAVTDLVSEQWWPDRTITSIHGDN